MTTPNKEAGDAHTESAATLTRGPELVVGLVLMAEIFNTAIESLARAPGSRRHPRFRDALDMASAAVLLAAITAATIGVIVFGPRIVMWMPR